MSSLPAQTQLVPYLRPTVDRRDLTYGAKVRSPYLASNIDLTVANCAYGVLSFQEDVPSVVVPSTGPIRFALRTIDDFKAVGRKCVTHEEPPLTDELAAFDFLPYMSETTRVHSIMRIPGTNVCRVSIHDKPRRRRSVAYVQLNQPAMYNILLNGTVDPWSGIPIQTAMGYVDRASGEPRPLLVHPLGRGSWDSRCPTVEGAYKPPKTPEGWAALEFTGTSWIARHPSDPIRRPKAW